MNSDRQDTQVKPVLNSIPEGRLGIVPLQSMSEFGKKVNDFLVEWRKERVLSGVVDNTNDYYRENYVIESNVPRFSSGEAKGSIRETIRGDDLYFMVDVMNHSLTYKMSGYDNIMSPDDHFADLKRVIAATCKKAQRVNVIMPYLYEGRQLNVNTRETQDCAEALQELVSIGAENIITFDAHDTRVQNAIPLDGFETVSPSYQFIKNVLRSTPDLKIDNDHLMIVSPDEAGMSRAIYLANVLGIDMGMFYMRRDFTQTVDGMNPIIAHEFLGSEVAGKDIIIVDDMISSGAGVLKTAELLKKRNANRIFICATFGILTKGTAAFDEAYEKGIFHRLITTNLIHQPEELLEREYYVSCDMCKFVALIIDTLNHDASLSSLLNPVDRIKKVVEKYERGEKI